MPLQWIIEEQTDHILVLVNGQWHVPSLRNMIDEVATVCREHGYDRVLCDCREMRGLAVDADRFLIGVHIAERLKGTRFAALLRADMSVTKFGERVANSRGAQMLSTTDPEEARRWLFGVS